MKRALFIITLVCTLFGCSLFKDLNREPYNKIMFDKAMDEKLKSILAQNVAKFKAKGGFYILLDTNTAQILSMGNEGKIDYFDYAYEPGGTMSTIFVASALDNGIYKENDVFDTSEIIELRSVTVRDYSFPYVERYIKLQDVLKRVSSVALAKIALKTGMVKNHEFLYDLNFYTPLKTDKTESKNTFHWTGYNLETAMVYSSWGYGVKISPIYMVSAYNALLNDGIYKYPYFEKQNNIAVKKVVSKDTSQKIKKFLREAVKEGTAKQANIEDIDVYLKTSTVNKAGKDGKHDKKAKINSVIGGFEVDNSQYTLMVLLDEPKAIEETYSFNTSGWNTVPLARELIKVIAKKE